MAEQPPVFKIDARYSDEQLAQMATLMEQITPERQQRLQDTMNDTESKEFYRGLVCGYAACRALLQQIPAAFITEDVTVTTAFLAAKLRKMKSIDRLPGAKL